MKDPRTYRRINIDIRSLLEKKPAVTLYGTESGYPDSMSREVSLKCKCGCEAFSVIQQFDLKRAFLILSENVDLTVEE